jgi:hypothetical protein
MSMFSFKYKFVHNFERDKTKFHVECKFVSSTIYPQNREHSNHDKTWASLKAATKPHNKLFTLKETSILKIYLFMFS